MPPEIDPNKNPDPAANSSHDELKVLKAELEQLKKEKGEWDKNEESLNQKVKKEREEKEKKESETKVLESALKFNLMSSDFLKANESILPKEVPDLFRAAEKEKYESPMQKANATKAAIIQSFFCVQSNMDLLTSFHKSMLEDYLKLTKNGKEEKADHIFENIFEPALEAVKRIKKTEELIKSKEGFGINTDADQAYKEKLTKMAEKKFFGGKINA